MKWKDCEDLVLKHPWLNEVFEKIRVADERRRLHYWVDTIAQIDFKPFKCANPAWSNKELGTSLVGYPGAPGITQTCNPLWVMRTEDGQPQAISLESKAAKKRTYTLAESMRVALGKSERSNQGFRVYAIVKPHTVRAPRHKMVSHILDIFQWPEDLFVEDWIRGTPTWRGHSR